MIFCCDFLFYFLFSILISVLLSLSLQHPSMAIVKGAGLVMKAIIEVRFYSFVK